MLLNNNKLCVKKTGEENFDVWMGFYDSAEDCELVGTYILNKLKNVTNKVRIGLYQDDTLGMVQKITKSEIERKKKQTVKLLKGCSLSITIECQLKSVDFLHVAFDLENDIYKPYRKPNNKSLYINKHSYHPPNILMQLPKSTEKHISETSSDLDVFNITINIDNDALHESNFKWTLQFLKPASKNNDENQKHKRRRNII